VINGLQQKNVIVSKRGVSNAYVIMIIES